MPQPTLKSQHTIRAAVIDLNNNVANEGMRCIKEMLELYREEKGIPITYQVFDARHKNEIPDLSFDLYISSGGPGSPYDDEGSDWEIRYFELIQKIREINLGSSEKKYFFFICHSFQLMCRCFGIGEISKRESMAFGVTQVHRTLAGQKDPLFNGLEQVFYVADFRSYQVLHPNEEHLAQLGAKVLTVERLMHNENRPRAITSVRLTREMVGTQFHPEADATGMKVHFQKPEKKQMIIEKYGEEKYSQLISRFDNPEMIDRTHNAILPNFMNEVCHHFLGINLSDASDASSQKLAM